MKFLHLKRIHVLLAAVFGLMAFCLLPGCQTYQPSGMADGENFPGINPVTIVINETKEASLTGLVKNALQEQIRVMPGLRKTPSEQAVTLTVSLENVTSSAYASSRLQERDAREHKSDEYQTTMYKAQIQARCQAVRPDGSVVFSKNYTGTGLFPQMADFEAAYQSGCRLAAQDLVNKIFVQIRDVDSWKASGN